MSSSSTVAPVSNLGKATLPACGGVPLEPALMPRKELVCEFHVLGDGGAMPAHDGIGRLHSHECSDFAECAVASA